MRKFLYLSYAMQSAFGVPTYTIIFIPLPSMKYATLRKIKTKYFLGKSSVVLLLKTIAEGKAEVLQSLSYKMTLFFAVLLSKEQLNTVIPGKKKREITRAQTLCDQDTCLW